MVEGMRVTRGTPTDEELAALVGALVTVPSGVAAAPAPVSRWGRSARPQPRLGVRGPDAWRTSGLPRPR